MTEYLLELNEKLDLLLARTIPVCGRYLSVTHAASYADLSSRSIRRLIKSGALTDYRPVRGTILVDRLELERTIAGSAGRRLRDGRGQALAKASKRRIQLERAEENKCGGNDFDRTEPPR